MTTEPNDNKRILARYLPLSAVDSVYDFIMRHRVHFRITGTRTSKLGDYRMPQPRHPFHEISINGDLGKNFFLLVLLHEMAHLNTFLLYGRKVKPHGYEWQEAYRTLLLEYSDGGHFPSASKPFFDNYTRNIPLNRAAASELERFLKDLDFQNTNDVPSSVAEPQLPVTHHYQTLSELPIGTIFRIKNRPGQTFRSEEKRRTRFRCVDIATGKNWLVSGNAEVVCEETSHKLSVN